MKEKSRPDPLDDLIGVDLAYGSAKQAKRFVNELESCMGFYNKQHVNRPNNTRLNEVCKLALMKSLLVDNLCVAH